jgi:hypothetical protein
LRVVLGKYRNDIKQRRKILSNYQPKVD